MINWQSTYEKWDNYRDLDSSLKKQLNKMKANGKELEDAFYQKLSFGTGGMRGILGPGTNRMNIYTVRKAVEGLAVYLKENGVNVNDRGVAIAYDSRHMSREFALEAAKVLGVHGIRSYVFTSLRPTPLLSFAVRYLGTVAGIMITASHNPPEYNGFKVYNEEGSQITLAEADAIIQSIENVADELTVPVLGVADLEADNLLQWLSDEVDHAYLQQLLQISKMNDKTLNQEKNLQIVFTPLHGTSYYLVTEGLKQLNFHSINVVEEQAEPDPEFSTVKSPNPEEDQAFTEAIKLGKKVKADILLATDPDADRLGVAVRNDLGDYTLLTGNQLGSLLLDYILIHSDPAVLKSARMLKTIVTSELGRDVAQSYGVQTIDTLTGFKYIGEKINQFDATGETFIFGYEESYGYLISGFSRDKDAIQAAVMACEIANYWKGKEKTLIDRLYDLYYEHGFYKEGIGSLTLKGKAGSRKIIELMDQARHETLEEIAGLKTICIEDYLVGKRKYLDDSDETEEIRLPRENVIKYKLENGGWICLRPSGTEPKIKWYYGVCEKTEEESQKKLNDLKEALDQMMLQSVKI